MAILDNPFNVDQGWAPQRVDSNVYESQVSMYTGLSARMGNVIVQRTDGAWEFQASPDRSVASPKDYWMVVRAEEKDNDATGLIIAVKSPMIVTIPYDANHFTLSASYTVTKYLTANAIGGLQLAVDKDQIIAKVYADLRSTKNALQIEWTSGTERMF